MHLIDDVRRAIPMLRRCGRALTGDQRLADACVIAIMDEVLAGADLLGARTDVRTTLYRAYLRNLESHTSELTRSVATVARQAHWLRTVEEFCDASLAEILDVSPQQLAVLSDTYEQETKQLASARIQIIEDEALIALDIRRMLQRMHHQVAGVARTHDAAGRMHRSTEPELIISDIRLADGSTGITALEEIRRTSNTPVVFITALPEQLLTGAPGEPEFVLSKPLDRAAVSAAVTQALFFHRSSPRAA